jgi:hypothetical protein
MSSSIFQNPRMQGLMGSYGNFRGKLNVVTLITALILSALVINNYNQCEAGKGYGDNGFVTFSYGFAIAIIVIVCLLFGLDIFKWFAKGR